MFDIIIKNISKSFDGKKVLDNFSCELAHGKTTVLMGESGCGKTTLANIILKIIKPDTGEIIGVPTKTAAVFQENRLCQTFDALTNTSLVTAHNDKSRAAEILINLGLGDDMHKKTCDLSGGMQRRVAIARALAADADFVLLDEPFRELDEATRNATAAYTRAMLLGKTVVLITHDKTDAEVFNAPIINI